MTGPRVTKAAVRTDFSSGHVTADGPSEVVVVERRFADLVDVFADEAARLALPQDRLAYRTECVFPVPEGTEGGLFWGTTFIEPGQVGDEFFMTKGHFHTKGDRMETYLTYSGTGLLVLMSRDRRCWAEEMTPGSVHMIAAHTAHRAVNTGSATLAFGASWPSDAGHDYATIAADGFACRVIGVGGLPQLVSV